MKRSHTYYKIILNFIALGTLRMLKQMIALVFHSLFVIGNISIGVNV